jgi:hypothetical protein
MQISRLPQALVRDEHGMRKDHVVVVNEEGEQPLALRVNGAFAGYLAGALSDLATMPGAAELLERRLAQAGLMDETKTVVRDVMRTVKRKQAALAS